MNAKKKRTNKGVEKMYTYFPVYFHPDISLFLIVF